MIFIILLVINIIIYNNIILLIIHIINIIIYNIIHVIVLAIFLVLLIILQRLNDNIIDDTF